MIIAVYGLPCSGKTTLINRIKNAKVINGRGELERISEGRFSLMNDEEKEEIRIRYTRFLSGLRDNLVVSDGHYSFLNKVVFTEQDGDVYDVIFYLYCDPKTIYGRIKDSDKNEKYKSLSAETLDQWQSYEIENLRDECHKRNKDFYVISDNAQNSVFYEFLEEVKKGFSNVKYAKQLSVSISKRFPLDSVNSLVIVDGDKTMINQDSFKHCMNGKTKVFDGDFYSGYQSYLFNKEIGEMVCAPEKIDTISINKVVWNIISKEPYIVISSGIKCIWNWLKDKYKLSLVIADPIISADTKYYVVKFLQEMGYFVTAIGDSKNDYYMLRKADRGILVIGDRISKSLNKTNVDGIELVYDKSPFILIQDEIDDKDRNNIEMCKSNSGINGSPLALAHFNLGQKIGKIMKSQYPSDNTAVLVLERGGRFFGDGFYCSFGGVFYSYNSSKEIIPDIKQGRIIIVDSVINTGDSIKSIITEIEKKNKSTDIVIVSNVICEKSVELFRDYKVYSVRISHNSYVGLRQALQIGEKGPDTADRLYNIINRSF